MNLANRPTVDLLTGLRPSGALTLANYAGAVKPIVEAQVQSEGTILLFVADLHALTDQEPHWVATHAQSTAADLLALGIDPARVQLYLQSTLMHEVNELAGYLERHVRVAELLRLPALKDKLRDSQQAENASAALLLYPVLMAADILLHRTRQVPVGQDQLAHLEIARLLARRFNAAQATVLVEPQPLQVDAPRFLALRGAGKMSKSEPATALLLSDDERVLRGKIAGCQTANEGEMSPHLASHANLIRALSDEPAARAELDALLARHLRGEAVMRDFKELFAAVVLRFVAAVRTRRARRSASEVHAVLNEGAAFARTSARATLAAVREAMHIQLAA